MAQDDCTTHPTHILFPTHQPHSVPTSPTHHILYPRTEPTPTLIHLLQPSTCPLYLHALAKTGLNNHESETRYVLLQSPK